MAKPEWGGHFGPQPPFRRLVVRSSAPHRAGKKALSKRSAKPQAQLIRDALRAFTHTSNLPPLPARWVWRIAKSGNWKARKSPVARKILFYIGLALIPVAIFGLMPWVAQARLTVALNLVSCILGGDGALGTIRALPDRSAQASR